jgi:hypothetical protein
MIASSLQPYRINGGATASVSCESREELVEAFHALADWLEAHIYATLVAVNVDTEFVDFVFDAVNDEDLDF